MIEVEGSMVEPGHLALLGIDVEALLVHLAELGTVLVF